jgi:hypothetical protein
MTRAASTLTGLVGRTSDVLNTVIPGPHSGARDPDPLTMQSRAKRSGNAFSPSVVVMDPRLHGDDKERPAPNEKGGPKAALNSC